MRGLKIKNGVIENIALFDKLPTGWIAGPDSVGRGWLDNGDGTFSEPVITVTLAEAKSAKMRYVNDERDKAIIRNTKRLLPLT